MPQRVIPAARTNKKGFSKLFHFYFVYNYLTIIFKLKMNFYKLVKYVILKKLWQTVVATLTQSTQSVTLFCCSLKTI